MDAASERPVEGQAAAQPPAPRARLPRGPVLDWPSFGGARGAGLDSVERLPHRLYTTSGRAAIYQALLQLDLPPASGVLVPTYHCPTMIAPVLCANLLPAYFGLTADGLPDLGSIDDATAGRSRAMIVTHYFGMARSLQAVRDWCDAHGVALIEDCAHAYFGAAGSRPVGGWGDFATASVSKFFPVPEAGVLASALRALKPVALARPSALAQVKGIIDVLESATQHGRLRGLGHGLAGLFRLKNRHAARASAAGGDSAAVESAAAMQSGCDMARIGQAPLWVSLALERGLPRQRIVALRRRNFALYAQYLADVPGARPLFALPEASAPYVFPLHLEAADVADAVYAGLRRAGMPVFRWDRIWPGTPRMPGDVGPQWSRHVLQLLCHQDLSAADIARTARTLLGLLAAARPAPRPARDVEPTTTMVRTETPSPAATAGLTWQRLAAGALRDDPVLAAAWDRLNAARRDLPFLSAYAVVAALDAFGDGSEQLLVARRGATPVAMLVLAPQGWLRWQTFQPSQIPLGTWVAEPALDLDALVDGLLRGPLGPCLALTVTQIDPLMAPRAADAPCREHADYIETAWIDVAGPFDAYWSARGKNLRQNLRKQRNKLAAEGVRTTLRVLHGAGDMKPALVRYGLLESSGWKAGGGTAIHADNAQGRFYGALLEAAARRGEAVVCEYLFDDRTVAMNLCLRRGGAWAVLKTTYDESIKLFSPASLLREEELQTCFADGSTRIEYFGRLMEWHSKLTDARRTLYHLTAYRWPVVRTLAELRRRNAAEAPAAPAAAQAPAAAPAPVAAPADV